MQNARLTNRDDGNMVSGVRLAACSRPDVLPCRLEAHAAEKARSELTHATEEWEEVLGAQDKADQVLDL